MSEKDVHPVQRKAALKGDYRVKKIRDSYKRRGWEVDNRPVNANGVDLVCYKKQKPNDPNAICIDGEYYPSEIVKAFEITNWKKDSWMSIHRALDIIRNLNSEAKNQKVLHPKAYILKILVISYSNNIEHIKLDLWMNNQVYIETYGYDEEPPSDEEEAVDGWVERAR